MNQIVHHDDNDLNEPASVVMGLASNEDDLNQAYRLVYKQYIDKGYTEEMANQKIITSWNTLPQTYTVVAKVSGVVVGTLSFIVDSPIGLPMDDISKASLDGLRNKGRRLCELVGLAIDAAACDKSIVMRLFQFGLMMSLNYMKVTDYVITVNPRHRFFYIKKLCFQALGETSKYKKVKNAPAVSMRLNLLSLADVYYEKYEKSVGSKNLYDYFFVKDQAAIRRQVAEGFSARHGEATLARLYHFYKKEASFLEDPLDNELLRQLWKNKGRENDFEVYSDAVGNEA